MTSRLNLNWIELMCYSLNQISEIEFYFKKGTFRNSLFLDLLLLLLLILLTIINKTINLDTF